jgi:hypothetical protein
MENDITPLHLLTLKEVAAMLRKSQRTTMRMIERKEILRQQLPRAGLERVRPLRFKAVHYFCFSAP